MPMFFLNKEKNEKDTCFFFPCFFLVALVALMLKEAF
jgi:hypothetical protein